MPYVSRAERASAKWMDIPNAIQHICAADNCDRAKAEIQLRAALTDGALRPLKWQDESIPPMSASTMTIPTDAPPQKGADWQKADIDWQAGTVLDLWGEYRFQKRRIVLLPAIQVMQHWRGSLNGRTRKKPTKQDDVRKWVADNYPNGLPGTITHKTIARATGVEERTVRRALGGK